MAALFPVSLAACSRSAAGAPTPTIAVTPTALPTPRPTATATRPLPTPTPSPTPLPPDPAVIAGEQPLAEDGALRISRVVSPQSGWLVLHSDAAGRPGPVLAVAPVAAGEQDDLILIVEPIQATNTLHALLYLNEGGATGEPADFDPAAAVATATFAVELQVPLPAILVADQAVGPDGLVRVDSVVSIGPGWLVLYADAGGDFGPRLGLAPLRDGLNENVVVAINWLDATPLLHAALHLDDGQPGRFEYPAADPPVVIQGIPLASPFAITLPPDIHVLDQAIVNGQIVVERVISDGPGWVVVQFDDDGQPGLIIGFAHLEDGLNEQVVVPLRESAVTTLLYATLHHDTGAVGEFDFPANDDAVRYAGRAVEPTVIRTNPGNYLLTADQPLADGRVTIPYVVADTNLWVVIYRDVDGELAGTLGQTWVPAGVNRDVIVEIDTGRLTPTLRAVLHVDAAELQRFDYPGGDDLPLQRNGRLIAAPFAILQGEE